MPTTVTPTSILDALDAALLAKAAYVDFNAGDGATDFSLEFALINRGGFTQAEARYISSRYRLEEITSTATEPYAFAVGLNATLWRRKDAGGGLTNEYVIGFGGTEPPPDLAFLPDGFADWLLAKNGDALFQTRALRNWVRRLFADPSETVFGLPGTGRRSPPPYSPFLNRSSPGSIRRSSGAT